MRKEDSAYLEAKKISSLMHSPNALKLIKQEDYENYIYEENFLGKLLLITYTYKNKEILDYQIKKNIYELINILRFETKFNTKEEKINIYNKVNDIITLTNSGKDTNSEIFYFKEYTKRIDKIVHPKNEWRYKSYFEEIGLLSIKESIENDFYYLNGLVNPIYKENFETYIVPELLMNEEFILSLNAMLKENIEFFKQDDVNQKVRFILENSLKLMLGMKTIYEKEESDEVSFNKILKTKKLINKIK